MKRLFALSVVVCLMLAGVVLAQESVENNTATEQVSSPKEQRIDVGEDEPGTGPRTGVNEGAVMPAYESYDEDTGTPDVVPSDTEGGIE